jgi:hypothetical protein
MAFSIIEHIDNFSYFEGLGPPASFDFRISLEKTINSTDRLLGLGQEPVSRPLPTQDKHRKSARNISMPRVRFEPTIPVLERAKTFHASDSAAIVIGTICVCVRNLRCSIGLILTWSLTLREERSLRVFENRRIFGPNREEVAGDRRNNLYFLSSIIRMIKSRRIRWAWNVARMGKKRGMHIGYWWESQNERDH